MELTTNNLIKIIIAVFVIVVVIAGIYLGMRNYVIPYFSGIGFEENDTGIGVGGDFEVCKGKDGEDIVGTLRKEGELYYFVDTNNYEPKIYFSDNGEVKRDVWGWGNDVPLGRVNGVEIEIYTDKKTDYHTEVLDGALVGGLEICIP